MDTDRHDVERHIEASPQQIHETLERSATAAERPS
jgi:hypothetical protein